MPRYKTETRPGLVTLYDIRPGNGAGQFLQPRSPHGASLQGKRGHPIMFILIGTLKCPKKYFLILRWILILTCSTVQPKCYCVYSTAAGRRHLCSADTVKLSAQRTRTVVGATALAVSAAGTVYQQSLDWRRPSRHPHGSWKLFTPAVRSVTLNLANKFNQCTFSIAEHYDLFSDLIILRQAWWRRSYDVIPHRPHRTDRETAEG